MRRLLRLYLAAVASCVSLLGVQGCAGTYASEGAKAGLVGGAVAGAVGSLFWGGNVVGNMAASAAVSAAAGAAVGGMVDKPAPHEDAAPATEPDTELESKADLVKRDSALAERIGPENFEAARRLARCDHVRAIQYARRAFDVEQSQERRAYALMIEAVAAEEQGDTDTAAAVYPRLVQLEPSRENVVKARNDALSGILKVQQVRKDYDLPATCG